MDMSQPFTHLVEQAPRFNAENLSDARAEQLEVSQPQSPTESQWRRVLSVIWVEGEMRYLVERGQ
jgi:hypothetical protein